MVVFHNDIVNAIARARNIRHLLAANILERWQQGEEATSEQTESLIQLGDWIGFLTDAEQLVVEDCIESDDIWNIIQQINEQAVGLDCTGTDLSYLNLPPAPVPNVYNYVESVTGLNTNNADPQHPVVRISVDGVTITGQGTPASPLVASIPPTIVQSVTDDGNGVVSVDNTDPVNPIVEFNGVNVDGVTIIGDGTTGNPLTAIGGGGGGVTSVSATAPLTSSGGTTPTISTSMNANKLIGRSTAGVGVMEEITVGSGLSLSAGTLTATGGGGGGTVTSVGLTMPSAFQVANSPVTGAGTLTVTGAGVVSQYIRGDGTLANFPSSSGGGSSVSYYLNGSVVQQNISGAFYYEMGRVANTGAAANFPLNFGTSGYIANFLTDVGDPALLNIPAGNWNFELWFSASSNGGSPSFSVELYKYDGSLSLIASSASPEIITNGTAIDLYTTALSVPATTLSITDRLAIRIFVVRDGRTITLHTQNGYLCQVITTFTTGITALNGLTEQVQNFATPANAGTAPNWSSSLGTHTLNIPLASASGVTQGLISNTEYNTFNGKEPSITAGTTAQYWRGDKSWQTLDKTAVGLGNVDNTSDATKNSAAVTLTNKRINPRTSLVTNNTTPSINTDNVDYFSNTGLAGPITSWTITGTPAIGQTLWISITDNGVAGRAIAWGASFEASGNVPLPATTVAGVRLDVAFIWNDATGKWRCVGIA